MTRGLLAAAGVPLAGVRIVDGSGLSLVDRWTAGALADAAPRTMWLDPDLRPYITTSPCRSPARPARSSTGCATGPARGLVRAKTGTTANASALSGFVGDRYVFSIVENGRPVEPRAAERSQDALRAGARARGAEP